MIYTYMYILFTYIHIYFIFIYVFLFEAQTQKKRSTSWPLLLGSNRCVLLDLPGTSVAWHVLESALDILS